MNKKAEEMLIDLLTEIVGTSDVYSEIKVRMLGDLIKELEG